MGIGIVRSGWRINFKITKISLCVFINFKQSRQQDWGLGRSRNTVAVGEPVAGPNINLLILNKIFFIFFILVSLRIL
jgi:hypothetical protein